MASFFYSHRPSWLSACIEMREGTIARMQAMEVSHLLTWLTYAFRIVRGQSWPLPLRMECCWAHPALWLANTQSIRGALVWIVQSLLGPNGKLEAVSQKGRSFYSEGGIALLKILTVWTEEPTSGSIQHSSQSQTRWSPWDLPGQTAQMAMQFQGSLGPLESHLFLCPPTKMGNPLGCWISGSQQQS